MADLSKWLFGCCITNKYGKDGDKIEEDKREKGRNYEENVEIERQFYEEAKHETTRLDDIREKVIQNSESAVMDHNDHVIPFEEAGLNMNAIPDSEIDKAPSLSLKIIEGPSTDQIYLINACGIVGMQGRGRKDGCVLVGSQEYADNIDEPYNDIVFEPGENSEIGKRHFLIKYIPDTTSYYLRDLGDGNGTFVRLDNPLVL